MPDSGRVTVESDVIYGSGAGRDLRCNVYRPPAGVVSGPAPAVILVHGGAWHQGDRMQLHGYGILLGRAGYVCVAVEYRLVPESPWPAQIHDVKAAIRWVRANAGDLGIDPDRIVIEGNSAGAHLALLAAGTAGIADFEGDGGNPGVSAAVAAVLAVYPPTLLFHGPFQRGGTPLMALSPAASADVAAAASPLSYVTADFPPTLLIHGTNDETVPVEASLLMYDALAAAGVPADLHLYAEQPHAFDAVSEFGRQCAAEMLLFLGRYVPDRTPAPTAAT
jgi:acetyl esterase/lipase